MDRRSFVAALCGAFALAKSAPAESAPLQGALAGAHTDGSLITPVKRGGRGRGMGMARGRRVGWRRGRGRA